MMTASAGRREAYRFLAATRSLLLIPCYGQWLSSSALGSLFGERVWVG